LKTTDSDSSKSCFKYFSILLSGEVIVLSLKSFVLLVGVITIAEENSCESFLGKTVLNNLFHDLLFSAFTKRNNLSLGIKVLIADLENIVWSTLAEHSNLIVVLWVSDGSSSLLSGRVEWNHFEDSVFLLSKHLNTVNTISHEELDDTLFSAVTLGHKFSLIIFLNSSTAVK